MPSLLLLKLVPVIAPPIVSVPALTLMFGLVRVIVTLPLPRFKSFVPLKVKLAVQVWVLLVESVMAVPLVLSSVPPLMVNMPVPIALALFMRSVPPLSVVPPV